MTAAYRSVKSAITRVPGVPANPGRPLIDFTNEIPPPVVLAVPAGGAGGIGCKQPSTVKQDLEASDRMLAAMDRAAYKVLAWLKMLSWLPGFTLPADLAGYNHAYVASVTVHILSMRCNTADTLVCSMGLPRGARWTGAQNALDMP